MNLLWSPEEQVYRSLVLSQDGPGKIKEVLSSMTLYSGVPGSKI